MTFCYINSIASISAQNFFEKNALGNVIAQQTNIIEAQHPKYSAFIKPALIRRMSTGVKMGVAAAKKAIAQANITTLDAIITGTGMGCIEDSEKFLTAILENNEQYLTPTSFIQSTHNTVGAQIALIEKCKAYNVTYVHGAVSFECALLDAQIMLQDNSVNTILVGGVDELGKTFIYDIIKMESLDKQGITIPFSEGAHFATLASKKQKSSYAKLIDVKIFHRINQKTIQQKMEQFLKQHNLSFVDIDAIVVGKNGDAYDVLYNRLLLQTHLKTIPHIVYKPFSGEYYTASAFGFWLAASILKQQFIPKPFIENSATVSRLKTIVLYNQFKGHQHSFILLSTC